MNTTGVAAILLLLWNPDSLFDVGFQMSFVAVILILVLGPVLRDGVPSAWRFKWSGSFTLFLGISVVVQAGLFPILAGTFGEFSIAGPLANTLGVPVTQALFLWSMLALPVSALWPVSAGYVMVPGEYLARILLWVVEVVGTQDASWIQITSLSPFTGGALVCGGRMPGYIAESRSAHEMAYCRSDGFMRDAGWRTGRKAQDRFAASGGLRCRAG